MTLAGYFLGQFEFVKVHFEKIVLGIIFVSVLPVIIGGIKHWLAQRSMQTNSDTTIPEERLLNYQIQFVHSNLVAATSANSNSKLSNPL